MKKHLFRLPGLVLLTLLLGTGTFGCGKKADTPAPTPVAPRKLSFLAIDINEYHDSNSQSADHRLSANGR